jgi:hypothetical protein
MKVTKILIAMLASAFIVTACDPIEDEDLRDKYVTDAGTPKPPYPLPNPSPTKTE